MTMLQDLLQRAVWKRKIERSLKPVPVTGHYEEQINLAEVTNYIKTKITDNLKEAEAIKNMAEGLEGEFTPENSKGWIQGTAVVNNISININISQNDLRELKWINIGLKRFKRKILDKLTDPNLIDYLQHIDDELENLITKKNTIKENVTDPIKLQNAFNWEQSIITILFVIADPSNESRLRLGEEKREIEHQLRMAERREHFEFKCKSSIRPEDFSQALLDYRPKIVHFSGHGTPEGQLLFENNTGSSKYIYPDALAEMFMLFADQIDCVVLNACYSEIQADAINKYINFVIGIPNKIVDKAAIAFSIGFYQAIGACEPFEVAYKFGCAQMHLQGFQNLPNPVIKKRKTEPSPTYQ